MIVAALVAVSCDRRPKGVLSDPEMVDLMVDMQLAEAYNDVANGYRTAEEQRRNYGAAVLRQHGVTPAQLDSTLSWYGRNIDEYQALYDKVDKELERRRKKVTGTSASDDNLDDIWPYTQNLVFSPLAPTTSYSFTIPSPAVGAGESVTWKMHLSSSVSPKMMLGVDYSDGTTSLSTRNLGVGMNTVTIKLQTDTAKTVVRLYGVMRLLRRSDLPLWVDSISLVKTPFDSTSYSSIGSQYILPRKRRPAPQVVTDTASVTTRHPDAPRSKADSIRMLPIGPGLENNRTKRTEL